MNEFPFCCGNKNLFTFLIRPYLNNKTLAKLAGTCRSVREYVLHDLKMHWFAEYLKINNLTAVNKFVRVKACKPSCFYGKYSFPVANITDQQLSDRAIYDEKGYAWGDLPFYVFNKKTGRLNRIFDVNGHKLIVCQSSCYQPKYHPITHYQNMKQMSDNVSYYHKVIFHLITRMNTIEMEQTMKSYQNDVSRYHEKLASAERQIKYYQSMLEVKYILDNPP
ncbi:MAG: hypothetical protein WD512_13890 [Candidatus Paceibacterota bacterium]